MEYYINLMEDVERNVVEKEIKDKRNGRKKLITNQNKINYNLRSKKKF